MNKIFQIPIKILNIIFKWQYSRHLSDTIDEILELEQSSTYLISYI